MTRSRSTSQKRRSTRSKVDEQTWDERLIRSLTPWKRELAGLLLFIFSVVTLLGLLNLTSPGLIEPWTKLLRQLAGWGAFPLCLIAAVAGLDIALRRFDLPVKLRPSQIIGLEVILIVALSISHLFFGGGLAGAQKGQGGGLIGWALSEPLHDFLGAPLMGVFLLATVALGAALVANIGYGQVVMWLNRTSTNLRLWSYDLDADVAERQAQIEAKRKASARQGQVSPGHSKPLPPRPQSEIAGISRGQSNRPARSTRRQPSLPPLDLLDEGSLSAISDADIHQKQAIIEQTLKDFGLPATVTEIRKGPAVTQFGVLPGYIQKSGPGGEIKQQKVRVSQIATLQKDLALALQVSRVRIEAPVPGRGIVGVEVPNSETNIVRLRAVIESDAFMKIKSSLAVGLGKDVSGSPVASDLGALPHLLIAGTTGSGKSVFLNALITCLVLNNSPEKLRLVLIDPKKVEFIRFNGLPHLLGRVEVEGDRIIGVLRWLTAEMDRRYQILEQFGARNIQEFNQKAALLNNSHETELPYIAVFIDELADLITAYPGDVEPTLCRLAQMARAIGIHLVVATQRPSTDVITGLIKANFPARASFAVTSNTDSRVVLDTVGADQLLGKGDMLFLAPDASVPARLQGCFVTDQEMERVVGYWQQLPFEPHPVLDVQEDVDESPWDKMIVRSNFVSERDEMLEEAIELAKNQEKISTSFIQRKLRIGYPRAARLMEALHELGLVEDPKEGGKTRRTYVSGDEDPLEEFLSS